MRIWLSLAAIALAASLTACGAKSGALAPLKSTPEQAEAYVAKLAAEPFKTDAKALTDMAGVRDALPKEITLTWAGQSFDAATGATVLTGVKLTPADVPDVGISIAEVRLWDFDAAFAKARLDGQRLTETAKLARRIEAKDIQVFGLETLFNSAMSGVNEAMAGAITDAVTQNGGPDIAAEIDSEIGDVKLDSYKIGISRVLIDDVMLRPYAMKAVTLPVGDDAAELMQLLQPFAAVSRSFAYDTMGMFDMIGEFAMTQAGQPLAMTFKIDTTVTRGMRGGDFDVYASRGIAFDANMPVEEIPTPLHFVLNYDLMSMQGGRLDKLYSYLALGEWPKRTDKDLIKLDDYSVKGERWVVNDHAIYSVAESKITLPGSEWLIPTKLTVSATDVVYDVKGILDLVNEFGPALELDRSVAVDPATGEPAAPKPATPKPRAGAAPAAPAEPLVPPEVMALITKYGLDKPSMDFNVGWTWNPATGAAVIDGAYGLDNYLRFDTKYEGGLPSFKAVSDLIPEDNPEKADEAAIGKVFEAASSLKAVEFNVVDEGGLEKIFGLAAEAAKMIPADQAAGAGAMLENQTPASLRAVSAAGVYALADQAAQMMPELKLLISPFGAFIEKGGKVRFSAKPAKPLPYAATMQAVESGMLTLEALVKQLNAKTVHTPPAAPK